MVIKDVSGGYSLEVDAKRNIVREVHNGFQTAEIAARFQDDYEAKILPQLKGKKWAKFSDMRTYKTSDINDNVNNHIAWAISNGLTHAAMIVESTIVRRQMNKSVPTEGFILKAFTDEAEADEWLKANGF